MRSKKFRMVVTGGFLTLIAAVALVQRGTTATEAVSGEKKQVTRQPQLSEATKPASAAAEEETQASLWTYTARPSNAEALEAMMAIPGKEVHYAQIDRAFVGGADSPLARVGGKAAVKLPDGTSVPVTITRTRNLGADRYVSEATIDGSEHGRAVFAYHKGEMSAVVDDFGTGSWQFRSVGGSVAQVFKVESSLVPPCGSDHSHHAHKQPAPAATQAGAPAPMAGAPAVAGSEWDVSAALGGWPMGNGWGWGWGNTEVRVLVPYSAVILTVLSEESVRSWIDLAVGALNNDLSRSGVPVTVTLAGAPAVQYHQEWHGSDDTAIDDALVRVASPVDGIMDEIHVHRADAKADIVVFALCQLDSNNSGVGYILARPGDAMNPAWAFSVVNFWYMNTGSVFSHEVGHNFGCNHDRDNARTTTGVAMGGAHSYSYGYRFYGEDGQQYRTIMAYDPGQVIPYFSNPNIWALGAPIGAPLGSWEEAYNALTIQQNAGEISNYRNTRAVTRTARRLRGW
jgi:hypothetical protein